MKNREENAHAALQKATTCSMATARCRETTSSHGPKAVKLKKKTCRCFAKSIIEKREIINF